MAQDDYCCVTVKSHPNEGVDAFNRRLIEFWSRMLREQKDAYQRVYAETAVLASHGDRASRQYLVGTEVVDLFERSLSAAGLGFEPIDVDEVYTRFEATSPDWFQIPH